MSIRLEVWGDYACFSRPEMKVERVSYDVMTPSAARGLVEAIFWHPGLRWHIDRIHVCNPIRFASIRRNEIKCKASASNMRTAMTRGGPLYIAAPAHVQQRASLVLTDVRYVIEAHFTMTEKAAAGDNPGKFQDMATRRMRRGQCYHQPCFGCREFPASFALFQGEAVDTDDSLKGEKDLGFMLYDMDYSDPADIRPLFFRAQLRDGVMNLRDCEVIG